MMKNRLLSGGLIAGVALFVLVLLLQSQRVEPSPETIRVGVLPDEAPEALRARYSGLLDYLSNETGITFQLIIPRDYQDLVRLFEEGQLDLANFGGLTYLRSHERIQAEALVMRDVDPAFSSYLIAKPAQQQGGLESYQGTRLAFGSKLSTSGHLMPRYFLQQQGIVVEDFFKQVSYSGAHDKTVYQVINGEADVGAVNSEILHQMLEDERISAADIHIVWQTPAYADYVWTIQHRVPESVRTDLRNAFLGLQLSDPVHAGILSDLGAGYFLPASDSAFTQLRVIAAAQGLLR